MPSPLPAASAAAGVTRRGALLGALVLGGALVGCTPAGPDQARPPAVLPAADPDPDIALAAAVLAEEEQMLARVRATAARHAGLRTRLAGTLDAHQRHVRLLRGAVPDQRPGGSSPTSSPLSSGAPAPEASPRVAGDRSAALRALSAAEDRLGLGNRQASFDARSGAFARLLASMAAAAAQQAAVLGGHVAGVPGAR